MKSLNSLSPKFIKKDTVFISNGTFSLIHGCYTFNATNVLEPFKYALCTWANEADEIGLGSIYSKISLTLPSS